MNTKPFYLSKTFWSNIVLGGIIMIFPSVGEKLTPETVAIVFGIVNIILRVVSKDQISIT